MTISMMVSTTTPAVAEALSDGLVAASVVAALGLAGWTVGARRAPAPVPARIRAARR
ncbi:hypothetical protein [Methylobacterium nigriterrae]|uniref:hypothetical protein n=1 Tax=Methylobacterium nigriterrae TaxID=3127512 RepID=UPI00301387F8